MIEIKAASYTHRAIPGPGEGLCVYIVVARWLAWYLPSTVVSCIQLTRYIPIMIYISMKFLTRIINAKREV